MMSNQIEVTMEHFAETSANARFRRTGEFSGVLDGVVISVLPEELPAKAEDEQSPADQGQVTQDDVVADRVEVAGRATDAEEDSTKGPAQ